MATDSELLSHELPAGYMLRDTYTLTETLGQGGFGITYLATEDVTERRVVVKENFPAEFSIRNSSNHHAGPAGASRKESYDWALGSFLNEAKILTRLRHPNIVPVLTAFKALGTAYYVMDYIGGLPLHKAAPQQVTEQWLLGILRPMLSALHYIHTLPDILLHRDIKPNNILVTAEGTPILIDFGAARSVISTHTHSKVGTPGYSPPEQLSNTTAPGPWTDLYALGATCYALITGQNPPDYHDRMFAAPGSDLLAHRAELQKRFSPALLASIDKAFALRPNNRWQSAKEWMAAIDSSYNTTATPVNGTRVPSIEEPAPTPKITQQAAQAELQRRGISAEEYDSKLYDAAKNGETELVKLLIAAGADVNKADEYGWTPLSEAAFKGHTECMKLLIDAGMDVNQGDNEGWIPLMHTAARGHTECMQLLLDAGADVNLADNENWTPLMFAATEGHAHCAQLLLHAGANVNQTVKDGRTPLSEATASGHTECVKLLIAAGADVNKANEKGNTPLYWAASKGHTECVKLLLAAGADVNKANKNGLTPLYWEAKEGHTECVKLLLAAGADVNQAEDYTPLYWAAWNGHTECVKLLIAAGADVNKADNYDYTPLHKATDYGNTECVKLLLAAGADVNKANIWGKTPLCWAAYKGHTEYVKLLIAAGADVNKADNKGKSPLFWAANIGHTECVKLLIAAGADVNKANEDGKTPLYVAEQRGHIECVKLLIAAGADVNKEDEDIALIPDIACEVPDIACEVPDIACEDIDPLPDIPYMGQDGATPNA